MEVVGPVAGHAGRRGGLERHERRRAAMATDARGPVMPADERIGRVAERLAVGLDAVVAAEARRPERRLVLCHVRGIEALVADEAGRRVECAERARMAIAAAGRRATAR